MAASVAPRPVAAAIDGPNPSRGESALVLERLTKRFVVRRGIAAALRGEPKRVVTAVDSVSLEIERARIFGLLGPNGAGKTTLCKIASTMLLPDEGSVTVEGFDIRHEDADVRRVLAAVPADERSLNWRLTARENLLLFAALNRLGRREAAERTEAVLRVVGLEDAGRKLVAGFSSGMRQRLLVARALIASPRVLLLDEPTRALDPMAAQELRRFFRDELVERQGCTIVLATHNAEEAFEFCDRVAVLDRGRVLAVGHAKDLAARYAEQRYRILTSDASHAAWAALEERGLLRRVSVRAAQEGWSLVECTLGDVNDETARSARLLRLLVESGVDVARFEHVGLSLADLIGRIIGASSAEVPRA
jgi:ABC-2 type transport system ATP-binding protein